MMSLKKMIGVIGVVAAAAMGSTAQADDMLETRLDGVAEAVRLLPTGDAQISIQRCIGAVADAKESGAKVSTKVKVPESFPGQKGGTATLGEIKAHCERANLPIVKQEFAGTIPRFRSILKDLKAKGADNQWGASTIDNNVRYCHDTAAQLVAGGIGPEELLKPSEGSAVKLGDLEAQICGPLRDEFKKVRDAELAPLRAVLKGDKLTFAEDAFPRGFYFVGGAESSDPAALAKNNVWFEVLQGNSATCLDPVYTYRRYQFDKSGKVAKKSEKTYCGDPGSKAYR